MWRSVLCKCISSNRWHIHNNKRIENMWQKTVSSLFNSNFFDNLHTIECSLLFKIITNEIKWCTCNFMFPNFPNFQIDTKIAPIGKWFCLYHSQPTHNPTHNPLTTQRHYSLPERHSTECDNKQTQICSKLDRLNYILDIKRFGSFIYMIQLGIVRWN